MTEKKKKRMREFLTDAEVKNIAKPAASGDKPANAGDKPANAKPKNAGTYWTYVGHPHLKLHRSVHTSTWRFVKTFKGRAYDMKIGDYPAMSLGQARTEADALLLAIQRGEYRTQLSGPQTADLSLADGWAILQERAKRKTTLATYEKLWRVQLRPFHKRGMVELATDYEAVRRWAMAIEKVPTRELSIALLSSIYGHARKRYPDMPAAPVQTIDRVKPKPATYDLSAASLAGHVAAVEEHPCRVRRALNRWLYLSGMRINSAITLTWDRVLADHVFVPEALMKRGGDFRLPLTAELRAILESLRHNGADEVFAPLCNYRVDGAWTNRIARSHFSTVAHELVPYVHAELLTAHSLKGMTAHYVRPPLETLAKAMATITAELDRRWAAAEEQR